MRTRETYLERIDHARNMARYHRLSIVETLFGEWGRVGRRGQSREHCCKTHEEACRLLEVQQTIRLRRGYR